MVDILNIVRFLTIVKFEFYPYNPYVNNTSGHSDDIRIPIQQQDLSTPRGSILYVEGRLMSKEIEQQKQPIIESNCVAFMFDEIQYELNGAEIDRIRNVGITSTLKSCFQAVLTMIMYNTRFILSTWYNTKNLMIPYISDDGYFNFCVPLSMLFL